MGSSTADESSSSSGRASLPESGPVPAPREPRPSPPADVHAVEHDSRDAELVAAIRDLLLTHLDLRVSSAETDLIESGLLDSLALVELLFELEREFEIDVMVEELDIEHFRSIARIAEFVAVRRAAQGSSA